MTWSRPYNLRDLSSRNTDGDIEASHPVVIAHTDGTCFVVWAQQIDTGGVLQVQYFTQRFSASESSLLAPTALTEPTLVGTSVNNQYADNDSPGYASVYYDDKALHVVAYSTSATDFNSSSLVLFLFDETGTPLWTIQEAGASPFGYDNMHIGQIPTADPDTWEFFLLYRDNYASGHDVVIKRLHVTDTFMFVGDTLLSSTPTLADPPDSGSYDYEGVIVESVSDIEASRPVVVLINQAGNGYSRSLYWDEASGITDAGWVANDARTPSGQGTWGWDTASEPFHYPGYFIGFDQGYQDPVYQENSALVLARLDNSDVLQIHDDATDPAYYWLQARIPDWGIGGEAQRHDVTLYGGQPVVVFDYLYTIANVETAGYAYIPECTPTDSYLMGRLLYDPFGRQATVGYPVGPLEIVEPYFSPAEGIAVIDTINDGAIALDTEGMFVTSKVGITPLGQHSVWVAYWRYSGGTDGYFSNCILYNVLLGFILDNTLAGALDDNRLQFVGDPSGM